MRNPDYISGNLQLSFANRDNSVQTIHSNNFDENGRTLIGLKSLYSSTLVPLAVDFTLVFPGFREYLSFNRLIHYVGNYKPSRVKLTILQETLSRYSAFDFMLLRILDICTFVADCILKALLEFIIRL